MDNPEEVLQALDEFSKMRPSEIPRELEDYLCFVAKTGDPVYQWSLIKPLFREKLVRVMTDFYENCPALDLASSPNIEHFNYDIMKCNLLELLESFASAPFTVQRICELLTAPRKQYNRVDKFMRAIEKNILVVSTKEPGPAARRSENGDSIVNGTINDDTPNTESSHEVEMESWVKDCTTESTATLPETENDVPLVETVLPPSKSIKDSCTDENLSAVRDKEVSVSSRLDMSVTNFIAAHDIPASSTLNTSTVDTSILCSSNIVNSTADEVSNIVNDVPEAIMNEDTSSQPSLETENDDTDVNNGRKLQTTFQSKDFSKIDDKTSSNYYQESIDSDDKNITDNDITQTHDKINSSDKDDDYHSNDLETAVPEKRARLDNDVIKIVENDVEKNSYSTTLDACENDVNTQHESTIDAVSELVASENTNNCDEPPTDKCKSDDDDNDDEDDTNREKTIAEFISAPSNEVDALKESSDDSNETTESSAPLSEAPRSIIEEPVLESSSSDNSQESLKSDEQHSNLVIAEAMDDDSKTSNSIIPDPIPIIEEPKDDTTSTVIDETIVVTPIVNDIDSYRRNNENTTCAAEANGQQNVPENDGVMDNNLIEATVGSDDNLKNHDNKNIVEDTVEAVLVERPELITNITPMDKDAEPAESMDVDAEDTITGFQQDEPMEEESGEIRS